MLAKENNIISYTARSQAALHFWCISLRIYSYRKLKIIKIFYGPISKIVIGLSLDALTIGP